MASTSFSEGIKNFFKSENGGTEEMTFTENKTPLVKDSKTILTSNRTSSDVYILLNSNQQSQNNIAGSRSSFLNSGIKTENNDEIITIDSDSDSELPVQNDNKESLIPSQTIKKELSIPSQNNHSEYALFTESVTPILEKFVPRVQSELVTSTTAPSFGETFSEISEHLSYPAVEKDSKPVLPVQSVFVPESYFQENSEEIKMEEEDCDDVDTSFCNRCGKLISENDEESSDYFCSCSRIQNVRENCVTISNAEIGIQENSVQVCQYCKKKIRGNLQNHCEFQCTAIETSRLLCNICTKSFADPHGLVRHVEVVHGTRINIPDALQFERIKNTKSLKVNDSGEQAIEKCSEQTAEHFAVTQSAEKYWSKLPLNKTGISDNFQSPNHTISNHLNSTKIFDTAVLRGNSNVCQLCKKVLSTKSALLLHTEYHCTKTAEIYKLVCEICSLRFAGPTSLQKHLKQNHNIKISLKEAIKARRVKTYESVVNGKIVNSAKKDDSEKNRTCELCNKTFSHASNLKVHSDFSCPKRETFKLVCDLCSEQCCAPYTLQLHYRKAHNITISYSQALSAKKVKPNEIPVTSYCSEKNRTCELCNKTFSNVSNLKVHCDFNCPKREAFKLVCDLCSRQCCAPYNLQCHYLKAHKVRLSYSQALSVKRVKPNVIPITSFSKDVDSENLQAVDNDVKRKLNFRKHPNEKPFHCKKCGRRFRTKVTMKYHVIANKCQQKREKSENNQNSVLEHLPPVDRTLPDEIKLRKRGAALYVDYSSTDESDFETGKDTFNIDDQSVNSRKSCSQVTKLQIKYNESKLDENNFCENYSSQNINTSGLNSSKETLNIKKNKNGKCKYCSKSFIRKGNLFNHERHCTRNGFRKNKLGKYRKLQNKEPGREKRFQCRTCGRMYQNIEFLLDHETIHTGTKRYCCEYCQKCFHHAVVYLSHISKCKLGNQKCKISGKETIANSASFTADNHVDYDESNNSKMCSNSDFCSRHEQSPNEDIVTLRKTTKSTDESPIPKLKNHQLVITCGLCNYTSSWPSTMNNHSLRSHQKIDLICQTCNGRYNDYNKLIDHLKLNGQSYYCDQTKKNEPDNPQVIEIIDLSSDSSSENESNDAEKPFSCSVCSKRYSSISLLIKHLQNHTTKE